jgi:hypothetical protein
MIYEYNRTYRLARHVNDLHFKWGVVDCNSLAVQQICNKDRNAFLYFPFKSAPQKQMTTENTCLSLQYKCFQNAMYSIFHTLLTSVFIYYK